MILPSSELLIPEWIQTMTTWLDRRLIYHNSYLGTGEPCKGSVREQVTKHLGLLAKIRGPTPLSQIRSYQEAPVPPPPTIPIPTRTVTSCKTADQNERRIDPMLGGDAVTMEEMCQRLRGEHLNEQQLVEHWACLKKHSLKDLKASVNTEATTNPTPSATNAHFNHEHNTKNENGSTGNGPEDFTNFQ